MTPDEIALNLEFEQQLHNMLYDENGNPKPTGQMDLLIFLAKETRFIRISFNKLREEHDERVLAGASCQAEVNIVDTTTKGIPKAWKITGSIGGLLLIAWLILLTLKSMGFSF
ncbi:MAG: hypothetical protein PHE50_09160 [Dehalococcoidales bacterium]|nr:hypothetical protein [Dehalococcoidales bacterium]